MDARRREWMEVMSRRNLRMIDTAIMTGLQQGTAFFASTCILAIGGCFAMLGSGDVVLRLYNELPFATATTARAWEAKLIGLCNDLRLFLLQVRLVLPAVQLLLHRDRRRSRWRRRNAGTGVARQWRAGELNVLAGNHFNAGLRGIFLSIGFMGWFAGPAAFVAASALICVILVRRQFFLRARLAGGIGRRGMKRGAPGLPHRARRPDARRRADRDDDFHLGWDLGMFGVIDLR